MAIVRTGDEGFVSVQVTIPERGNITIRDLDAATVGKATHLLARQYQGDVVVEPDVRFSPSKRVLGCQVALVVRVEEGYRIVQLQSEDEALEILDFVDKLLMQWAPGAILEYRLHHTVRVKPTPDSRSVVSPAMRERALRWLVFLLIAVVAAGAVAVICARHIDKRNERGGL